MSLHLINRLEKLDYLIRMRATGGPSELAEKLDISRRCLYDHINLLKQLEAPIEFNRIRNSYCYKEEGSFKFRFLKPNKNIG